MDGLTLYGFNQILPYLGYFGTYFIQTVFFIILIRIGFAFMFKFIRRNINYRSPVNNSGYSSRVNQRMNEAVKNTPAVES